MSFVTVEPSLYDLVDFKGQPDDTELLRVSLEDGSRLYFRAGFATSSNWGPLMLVTEISNIQAEEVREWIEERTGCTSQEEITLSRGEFSTGFFLLEQYSSGLIYRLGSKMKKYQPVSIGRARSWQG